MRSCKTISFSFRTNFLAVPPPPPSPPPCSAPCELARSITCSKSFRDTGIEVELSSLLLSVHVVAASCCCCCCCCLLYGFIYFSQVQPPSKSCRLVLAHHRSPSPRPSPILIPFPFPCLFHVLFCATNFYFMPLPLADWFLDSS